MKDTEFEQKARLLTNDGYFERFRELAPEMGVRAAWERLEGELPLGLRRFTNYTAFEKAKAKEQKRELPELIVFKFGH